MATKTALFRLCAAVWLFMAVVTLATAAPLSKALWQQAPPLSDRLGLAFPTDDPSQYWRIADMGLGIVRISAAWDRVEKVQGVYDFSGLDYRILALGKLGIASFLTFESNSPLHADLTDQVGNGVPKSRDAWHGFVQAVIERYDGDGKEDAPDLAVPVRYVQVANEFLSPKNRSGGWAGTHQELLNYINTGYAAAKAANPNVIFVLGGIAAFNMDAILIDAGRASFDVRQNWSPTSRTVIDANNLSTPEWRSTIDDRFYPILRDALYDVADVHLYGPETRDPERLSFMAKVSGRPILSSECGGPSTDYGVAYNGHRHFGAVLERNLAVLSSGGAFCLWFGLSEAIKTTYSNRKTPLLLTDLGAKPGADAYRILASLLSEGGEVTMPVPRLFVIASSAGPACIAFDATAKHALASQCGSAAQALCIIDAAHKETRQIATKSLPARCAQDGIALGGQGLSHLLLRNLHP